MSTNWCDLIPSMFHVRILSGGGFDASVEETTELSEDPSLKQGYIAQTPWGHADQ